MLGTAFHVVELVVVVLLAASLSMAPIFILMRMKRDRKEPIVVVSSDAARKHLAMIWLVRAGEAFIIGPLTVLALMIGLGFVISLNPFNPRTRPLIEIPDQPVASEICSVIMCIIILGVGLFIGRKLIDRLAKFDRHSFYEKLLRVGSNSVSTFSFVFAALSAYDVYHLMPAKHPEPGPGVSQLTAFFLDRHLWPLVFWGLWRLVYVVVCRVLELKPPTPPASAKEPPIDPETPEFPQKSPLVQM